ncbi:MAG: 6-carboxytetrahydropterin synthase [Planctomycetota bacterium]|nr:6-carboxytetrahydropterin synthase [Planctomycetota bacterium]
MYELSVQREFTAAHAVTMAGRRESPHSHDWRVTAVVTGAGLDEDGILCDFEAVQRRLEEIVRPLEGVDLNRTPPFDTVNPTAEHLARHIADHLAGTLPDGAVVTSVSVSEAPGCTATYRTSPPQR